MEGWMPDPNMIQDPVDKRLLDPPQDAFDANAFMRKDQQVHVLRHDDEGP